MKLKHLLLATLFYIFMFPRQIHAATYFVATNGSDSNTGSLDKPWQTIQKGVNALSSPGDTLYIRGGTYSTGKIDINNKNGSSSQNIVISGYQNERPNLNASEKIAALWDQFVFINNSQNLTIKNLELSNSRGRAIYIYKSGYITLQNLWVHDTALAAVWSDDISNLIIENGRFWKNNNTNDPNNPLYVSNMWMGAITPRGSSDASSPYATNIIIRKNEIFNQFGECINIHGRASDVVVEDNTIYNCWGPAIYYPNSKNILIQRNLVYHTNDSRYLRKGNPSSGIGSQKEHPPTRPGEMKNIKVLNNFVKGFTSNFFFWGYDGGFLEDTLIAHNTFVDAHSNSGNSGNNINIGTGRHLNTRFENNIIIQEDSSAQMGNSSGGVQFSNNLWSKSPSSSMQGQGDIVANPKLSRSGDTAAGSLKSDYFKILSGSPAINKGKQISITEDYFRNTRSTPDIGAHEFDGSNTPIPSQAITSTPYPTVTTAQLTSSLIVDHNDVAKFESLTDGEIAQASSVRLVLRRASVGGNISSGLDYLHSTNGKYDRSKWEFQSRGNPSWQTKISDLANIMNEKISEYDAFSMKFCYIDPNASFDTYKDTMVELAKKYPSKILIWWTMPITTTSDPRYENFNNKVRKYAQDNPGTILFDVAGIESHDPSGNQVTKNGQPVLDSSYTTDGGHLNTQGSLRVAKAFWYLMSKVNVLPQNTSTPTPIPTVTIQNITPTDRNYVVADIEPDGDVDNDDYNFVVNHFGETGTSGWIRADIVQNGIVDIYDFNKLFQYK